MITGSTCFSFFCIGCATISSIVFIREVCELIRQKMVMKGSCKELKMLRREVTILRAEVTSARRAALSAYAKARGRNTDAG